MDPATTAAAVAAVDGGRPRSVHLGPGQIAAHAVLTSALVGGLILAASTEVSVSWRTVWTAVALLVCGIVHAELTRHYSVHEIRSVDVPVVSALAVWVVGAILTLPLALVLIVAAVLHAHELFRGPPDRRHFGQVLASTGGAVLASLVLSSLNWSFSVEAMSSGTVLAAGLAGLLYLTATDGPSLLLGGARRPVLGAHSAVGGRGVCTYGATGAALGVLVGLLAHVSVLAVPLILLPVAYLQRSAHGRALSHAAAHDAKTQLWNLAAWQALSTAALAREHVAVLMVDLDHFKQLNDTYGHHAGDDVLTSVAHVLQTTTRRNDIVARFGGEEFSILLPGVTEQEACQAAERIRHQIAELTVITTNLSGRPTTISGVTASIGVATTHHADPASVDDLLVHADRWLYQAKEQGRNRVCGPMLATAV